MKRYMRVLLLPMALTTAGCATTNVVARWTTPPDTVDFGPYTVDIKAIKPEPIGTLTQTGGPQPGPVDIFDFRLDGSTVTFKATSPDQERTVTFTGGLKGDTMELRREVKVIEGGAPGGNGVFGVAGAPRVTLVREKQAK